MQESIAMPTIEENLTCWEYDWLHDGEDWSAPWGGSEAQWTNTILPRIQPFLPRQAMLEIGPGHGRWTERLRRHCESLTLVDLSPRCIEYCKARFAADRRLSYHANDGKSLSFIPDRSVDFVFSFDSLVHADPVVCRTYIQQIAKKLSPEGCCFLHHSNLGRYQDQLDDSTTFLVEHWRDRSMTGELMIEFCEETHLSCFKQELLAWRDSPWLIDAFSYIAPEDSRLAAPTEVILHPDFMSEVR
jgi:SAM-dependent methyltransferase